jgi:hypothetical protein
LPNLPYSVDEIYGIHASGKYNDLRSTYNELYHIYSPETFTEKVKPDTVIVEDSNSGYEFFHAICKENGIDCLSAKGKSNLKQTVPHRAGKVLIVADGAAIGSEMNELYQLMHMDDSVKCYLPESFEWIILKSGQIDGNTIKDILQHPEDFIESKEYFNWERFFTNLLIEYTKDTYLKYSKSHLNKAYLQGKVKKTILDVIKGVTLP